jgi:hypothetical protein
MLPLIFKELRLPCKLKQLASSVTTKVRDIKELERELPRTRKVFCTLQQNFFAMDRLFLLQGLLSFQAFHFIEVKHSSYREFLTIPP